MRIHFIQHVSFENPGSLLEWAIEKQHSITFTKIFEEVKFPSTAEFDFLIIMGGSMSANEEDKFSWLKEEKRFISEAINANKKVLGICLGSQLIAEALGAKVYVHTHKEIGWWLIKKVEKKIVLLKDLPDEFLTFHWHSDTFDLPQNATALFYSDACKNQAFSFSRNVLALQFHIEATTQLIEHMSEEDAHELIPAKYIQSKEVIQQLTPQHVGDQKKYLELLLHNFLSDQTI